MATRIDSAFPMISDFGGGGLLDVDANPDGSFTISWVTDADQDLVSDGIVVQRVAADGTPIGDTIELTNLPQVVVDALSSVADYNLPSVENASIAPLAGGGYALAYHVEAASTTTQIFRTVGSSTVFGPSGLIGVQSGALIQTIIGMPTTIFADSVPGASYAIVGTAINPTTGARFTKAVPLAIVDGKVRIEDSVFEAFAPDSRSFGIQITGLTAGSTYSAFVYGRQSHYIDSDTALLTQSASFTISGTTVSVSTALGRAESFDLGTFTPGPSGATFSLRILDSGAFDLQSQGFTRLPDGSYVKTVVPDANGVVAVPPAVLAALAGGDALITLQVAGLVSGSNLSVDISYRPVTNVEDGLFTQIFDAAGVAVGVPVRANSPANEPIDSLYIEDFSDHAIDISPRAGGGYAVSWIADGDGDGEIDALTIRKFTSSGVADGDPIELTGLDPRLINGLKGIDSVLPLVTFGGTTELEGGGYAIAYQFDRFSREIVRSENAAGGIAAFSLIGHVEKVFVSTPGFASPVSYSILSSNGEIPVVAVDGVITITDEIRAQAGTGNRLGLLATGLSGGSQLVLSYRAEEDWNYDPAAALGVEAKTMIVTNHTGILTTTTGRAEAFDVNTVTTTGGAANYLLAVTSARYLGDVPGIIATSNDTFLLPVVADANGIVVVPSALLDRLGFGDASISLIATNLATGSTFGGTVSVRPPTIMPEGIFTQLFDTDGSAVGPAILTSTPDADSVDETESDSGGVLVDRLPAGGAATFWAFDDDGDDIADGIAVQKFTTGGAKDGAVIKLSGLDPTILAEVAVTDYGSVQSEDVDLTALAGGGYAVTYYKDRPTDEDSFVLTLGTTQILASGGANMPPAPQTINNAAVLQFVGVPEFIVLTSGPALAGASFSLVIYGADGPSLFTVVPDNGTIFLTSEQRALAEATGRVALQVVSTAPGSVGLYTGVEQVRKYEASSPTQSATANVTVGANGVAALGSVAGRVESFDVGTVTADPSRPAPTYLLIANIAFDDAFASVLSANGFFSLPNGTWIKSVAPGAGGIVAVPPALLAAIGEVDASFALVVTNLLPGSSASADVTYRLPAVLEQGIFVQTFDAQGVALSPDGPPPPIDGDDTDNVLNGTDGDDTIRGFGGADTINGGLGTDELIGGTGNDIYIVADTADSIVELAGGGTDTVQSSVTYTLGSELENLTLTGGAAIDGLGNGLVNTITGNGAANMLNGAGGNDVLIGGGGNDSYVVDSSGDTIIELAGGGTDTVLSSATTFTLGAEVERLTLTGTANINGTGNTLSNIITGNSGNNTLDGGGGRDLFVGGAGNDTYVVDSGNDVVTELAGEGTDTVLSSATYVLSGEIERLTLTGGANINGVGNTLSNIITGNSGNNTLDGGGGRDLFVGGAGNDTYIIDSGNDVVTELAGGGLDTVQSSASYVLGAEVERLILTGSATIGGTGNALANTITGNGAANILDGGTGDDILIGGGGNDTYIVDATNDVISDSSGSDLVLSSAASFVIGTDIERLTLTGTGHINGTGNVLGNVITGNSGNNTLDGGGGRDQLIGGAGNDLYIVDSGNDDVIELAGGGTDTVRSTSSYILSADVENLELVGGLIINGLGNALANTITGNALQNILDGGTGDDVLIGGSGNDTYIVDSAGDVVTELAGGGGDLVKSTAANYTLGAEVEKLTLLGSADINGTGNTLSNVIVGNSGANILNGGGGRDLLLGGAGNDTYIVDSSNDEIVESSGGGIDSVQSSSGYVLWAQVENLILTGSAGTAGIGNDLANAITGNGGDNSIDGKLGLDTLTGGAGADQFLFTTAPGAGNIDTITDFSVIDDTIRLDDAVFAGLSLGVLAAGAFVNGTTALDANDRILYNAATGALLYDVDGAGGVAAVQFAVIGNIAAIAHADFLII